MAVVKSYMKNKNSKYLVEDQISLLNALQALNDTGKRIIFLVRNGKLRGALTYGDVSRWILKGNSLDFPAYEAATSAPISIQPEEVCEADRIFAEKRINALPVIDPEGRVVDILFKDKEAVCLEQIDIPVVIMAGGKGTRLYPYTKILPKPLIPIGEIPISEHIVRRFYDNGCRKFYFIVNYKKNMVKAYYNEIERSYEVTFVDEDKPLGTGGGLSLMKGMMSSTFILTNCDSFIDEDYSKILKKHKEKKNLVTMICSNRRYEVPYGVVEIDSSGVLTGMKEKPSFSYLTNTGTYIVEPEVIDMIQPDVPVGFPDVIQMVMDAGKNVGVYTVSESAWLDIGQFDTMDEMKKRLGIKDLRETRSGTNIIKLAHSRKGRSWDIRYLYSI